MSFEDLFTSSELDVIVPESSITFPPGPDSDEWLEQLNNIDRKEAFFDEHLQTLFTLRVQQPDSQQESFLESPEPSRLLLDFLAHVQILLEASYISPIAPNDDISEYTVSASPLPSSRLNPSSPPPRTSSIKKPTHLNLSGLLSPNPGSASHHPSILPPSTPNPTPASAAVDQRYLQAEGVVLTSRTWGQDVNGEGGEGFYLLWSKRDRAWVAVYKTVLNIAFLRLNFESPLLCLTFSATLRDKPLAIASSKSPLAVYIKSLDGILTPADPHSPTSPSTPVNANNDSKPAPETIDSEVSDPLEINLLAGLYAGPTFAPASSLGKRPPSTNTSTPTGTPTASRTTTDATELNTGLALKSFRKILETASGFKVRMRTVFVPAVLLDEAAENEEDLEDIGLEDEEDGNVGDRDYDDDAEGSDNDDDPDRLTSGASERTVVLCVEIETEGDPFYRSADAPDFVVEKVDISITGSAAGGGKEEGATASLIGWDTADSLTRKGAHIASFPLFLAPHEQHNLLYAVSFLHSPQEDATLDGVVKPSGPGKFLQRGVTIEVYGKPCYSYTSSDTSNTANASDGTAKVKAYHYPTPTFISRWNCVLDLSLSQQVPRRDLNAGDDYADYGGDTPLPTINALPEPPSPFPVPVSTSLAFPSASGPATTSMATTEKRHTLPNLPRILPSHVQSAGPGLVQGRQRRDSLPVPSLNTPATSKYTPPSVSAATTNQSLRSPTTYEAPPPPPFKDRGGGGGLGLSVTIPPSIDQAMGLMSPAAAVDVPPMTPAYPAFPNTNDIGTLPHNQLHNGPTTLISQGPLIPHGGNLPPNSANLSAIGYVGPSVEVKRERGIGIGVGYGGYGGYGGMGSALGSAIPSAIPQTPAPVIGFGTPAPGSRPRGGGGKPFDASKPDLIYPLSTFILDIFVFNRSTWTRRFEISCPDLRTKRKRREIESFAAVSRGPGKRRSEYTLSGVSTGSPDPGVLPLENRVRIGPLLPSACQSVRMKFLAVSPGVHSIDTLTLTDVESGLAMNLRSVMDVVVHEPA
ncbi:TRAPP trafficking subunit Trs65-domain-containing protein [Lentinula boryana]|uniref:TRAPP trafficking subunit Trs65-domain-containing protein n=1 Tax=Lentinula boryana TaxID=40481 RepID=A0ABQ8QMN0_9AGAR|nr:TRAPP trafficking subunit Trs65-domain-containing protein [Lentinula boryana]